MMYRFKPIDLMKCDPYLALKNSTWYSIPFSQFVFHYGLMSIITGLDDNVLIGIAGIVTAIAIAIFSPIFINYLDKKNRKNALKIALKYEIHKNFLECQEKKEFIVGAIPELEAGDSDETPAIHGFLHYTAYDAFIMSGFLVEEGSRIQELIESLYDEYHTVSHFLETDQDLMTFFEGNLLRLNKIRIFEELLIAVDRVEPLKIEFDRIFDVNE